MSEYERPERMIREPTVEDVRQLMGASTPHFALQIRNRIRNMIIGTSAPDHPARVAGEREIERLEQIAFGGESRGAPQERERPLPSVRLGRRAPVLSAMRLRACSAPRLSFGRIPRDVRRCPACRA